MRQNFRLPHYHTSGNRVPVVIYPSPCSPQRKAYELCIFQLSLLLKFVRQAQFYGIYTNEPLVSSYMRFKRRNVGSDQNHENEIEL